MTVRWLPGRQWFGSADSSRHCCSERRCRLHPAARSSTAIRSQVWIAPTSCCMQAVLRKVTGLPSRNPPVAMAALPTVGAVGRCEQKGKQAIVPSLRRCKEGPIASFEFIHAIIDRPYSVQNRSGPLHMSDVCLYSVHDLVDMPGEYELHHCDAKTIHLIGSNVRRKRECVRVGDGIDQRRAGMLERLLNSRADIVGIFDSDAHYAYRLCEPGEIRVLQVCLPVRQARGFHLELHHSERAVVEEEDLYWQIVLCDGQQIAQEHSQTPVARHRDYLSAGKCELSSNGLR